MHVYSKSLGSVTVRSGRISRFTKLGMAMTILGMPLSPAFGYQTVAFIAYISLSMVVKSKTLTLLFYSAWKILQPCVIIPKYNFFFDMLYLMVATSTLANMKLFIYIKVGETYFCRLCL